MGREKGKKWTKSLANYSLRYTRMCEEKEHSGRREGGNGMGRGRKGGGGGIFSSSSIDIHNYEDVSEFSVHFDLNPIFLSSSSSSCVAM